MTYEHVDWNEEVVKKKSQAEFIADGVREGQYKQFSLTDQVKILKEVYWMITNKQVKTDTYETVNRTSGPKKTTGL